MELIAEVGHPAAREALEGVGARWIEPVKWLLTLQQWLGRLTERGPEVRTRALIALARLAIPDAPAPGPRKAAAPVLELAQAALRAAEAWAIAPSTPRQQAAATAGRAALEAVTRVRGGSRADRERLRERVQTAVHAALSPSASGGRAAASAYVMCVRPFVVGDAVATIRNAVRGELLPWLLGADPLCASTADTTPPTDADAAEVEALRRRRVPRGRLALAASLGDRIASLTLGEATPRTRLDTDARVRLALARARARFELAGSDPAGPELTVLGLAERCALGHPSARALRAATVPLRREAMGGDASSAPTPSRQALLACAIAALVLGEPALVLHGWEVRTQRVLDRLLMDLSAPGARAALPRVRADLVPWLLGAGDPLRDRHGTGRVPRVTGDRPGE